MTEYLTFEVPLPPNLANGRMHWRVKNILQDGYMAALDVLLVGRWDSESILAMAKLGRKSKRREIRGSVAVIMGALDRASSDDPKPPRPSLPFRTARIRSTMYVGAPMDTGNAMNRHKWIEDWLVTRCFILDDNEKSLKWEDFPKQVVKRGQRYRIELTLTPIPKEKE